MSEITEATLAVWALPRIILEEWQKTIDRLDGALRLAAAARQAIALNEDHKTLAEAELALKVEGKNELERTARLRLALLDDDVWPKADVALQEARHASECATRGGTVEDARRHVITAMLHLSDALPLLVVGFDPLPDGR